MNAILYKNESDKIYIEKKITKVGNNITLRFKDETNIINPTIYISRSVNIKNVNYIYIEDLQRYYYIDNYELENQRYIIHASIDVLMSYKNTILDSDAIITRSSSTYKLYLDDPRQALYNVRRTKTLPFPSGFPISNGVKTQNFILTINGSGGAA